MTNSRFLLNHILIKKKAKKSQFPSGKDNPALLFFSPFESSQTNDCCWLVKAQPRASFTFGQELGVVPAHTLSVCHLRARTRAHTHSLTTVTPACFPALLLNDISSTEGTRPVGGNLILLPPPFLSVLHHKNQGISFFVRSTRGKKHTYRGVTQCIQVRVCDCTVPLQVQTAHAQAHIHKRG